MKTIHGVSILDTLDELVNPAHTALLVIDVQNDFCHPEGHFAKHGKDVSAIAAQMPAWRAFVTQAQSAGLFVVFVRQVTLPEGRSDSPAWLRLKTRDGKSPEYALKGSWGGDLIDGLVPRPSDVVMDKFRSDAFVRTPLDGLLSAQGIKTVVVIGTTTEGCVESTIRGASYHDYYVVPVTDLIAGPHPQLHANSIEFMRARYPVARADEVLQSWAQARLSSPVA